MYYSFPYKTKQFFWLAIKLAIVIGCGYLIYSKLLENDQLQFSVFYENLIFYDVFQIKNILLLLIFTFFNYFFEILKWESLASSYTKITRKAAAIQSLAALTASLITPNRIGEYGAKAMYFKQSLRTQIVGLNVVGNVYQMGMTIIFGVLGFGYFMYQHILSIDFYKVFKFLLFGLFVVFALFLCTKYFKCIGNSSNKVKTFIKKIPFRLHLKIALFSFLRFVVFSHQFYFLIGVFKVDISYLNAISAITSMYLIASIFPMLSLLDVVLKGTVAIWIFYFYGVEPVTILSITTLMWIANFVFPAIIGSYFVLTFKPNLVK